MDVTAQIAAMIAARAGFLHSVEFYVVATVIAAAVIILCTRPSGTKPVQTRFARAILRPDTGAAAADPSLEITVRDDGAVILVRHGLGQVRAGTAVALAVTIKGFDLTIKERVTARVPTSSASPEFSENPEHPEVPGSSDPSENMEAVFVLDFLAPEWYHIQYLNEHDGRFAAFTLHVRPGIHTTRPFKQ